MTGAVKPASRFSRLGASLLAATLLRVAFAKRKPEKRQSAWRASVPPLPIGGPTSAAWREEALARASELQALAEWIARNNDDQSAPDFLGQIKGRLDAVRKTAAGQDSRSNRKEQPLRFSTRTWSAWRGARFNRTLTNLDAVEADSSCLD